jgi:hypothetical protein
MDNDADRRARVRLQGSEGQQALSALPALERFLCGRLIARQLARRPKLPKNFAKYGPVGTVRLCSARALCVYQYALGIVWLLLTISGVRPADIVVGWLFAAESVYGLRRAASASVAGRRWRRERGARHLPDRT